jgi:hypothetical protein
VGLVVGTNVLEERVAFIVRVDVTTCKITRHYNPEDNSRCIQRCEKLRPQKNATDNSVTGDLFIFMCSIPCYGSWHSSQKEYSGKKWEETKSTVVDKVCTEYFNGLRYKVSEKGERDRRMDRSLSPVWKKIK